MYVLVCMQACALCAFSNFLAKRYETFDLEIPQPLSFQRSCSFSYISALKSILLTISTSNHQLIMNLAGLYLVIHDLFSRFKKLKRESLLIFFKTFLKYHKESNIHFFITYESRTEFSFAMRSFEVLR